MALNEAFLAQLCLELILAFFVLWRFVFRRVSEGPSTDHISLSSHSKPVRVGRAPSGGRRRAEPKVLTVEEAHRRMFSEEMMMRVWWWLQRLGVPVQHLRDVRQDVFEHAARSFHTYQPMKSRPERWLNKIAFNVASHFLEKAIHRRETYLDEDPDELPADGSDPGDLIDSHRLSGTLLELLETLEPELRHVVIAHELDDIPMAEIAAQLQIPLSTCYKLHARGMKRLREAEGKDERGMEAWLTAKSLLVPEHGCAVPSGQVTMLSSAVGTARCTGPTKS